MSNLLKSTWIPTKVLGFNGVKMSIKYNMPIIWIKFAGVLGAEISYPILVHHHLGQKRLGIIFSHLLEGKEIELKLSWGVGPEDSFIPLPVEIRFKD